MLIVVPETLVHQWLVEMLRRFNLHFRIFDEDRLDSLYDLIDEMDEDADQTPAENPFMAEQLVLCSIEFLAANPKHLAECLGAQWDLLVVDEAHHLQWSPDHASAEYLLVEQLAAQTKGVLLLTATPEQLGKESHFARLRLLDPERFPDFNAFCEEEKSYEPIAQVVEDLLENRELSEADMALLQQTIDEGDNKVLLDQLGASEKTLRPKALRQAQDDRENQAVEDALRQAQDDRGSDAVDGQDARIELVEHLLDRHGTGRVLFRNTRAAVKGLSLIHI